MIVTCPSCGSTELAEVAQITTIAMCAITKTETGYEFDYSGEEEMSDPNEQDEIFCCSCCEEFRLP